jgi:hypothetical protein
VDGLLRHDPHFNAKRLIQTVPALKVSPIAGSDMLSLMITRHPEPILGGLAGCYPLRDSEEEQGMVKVVRSGRRAQA